MTNVDTETTRAENARFDTKAWPFPTMLTDLPGLGSVPADLFQHAPELHAPELHAEYGGRAEYNDDVDFGRQVAFLERDARRIAHPVEERAFDHNIRSWAMDECGTWYPKPRGPLVINLYGGPCSKKSTMAAGLFFEMKIRGVNCELITEYAKVRSWLGDHGTLRHQPYVTAKQHFRQTMLEDQVEAMVTDSPFLLGLVYQGNGCLPSWERWVLDAYGQFDNLNIILARDPNIPYNPLGRNQSEAEARAKDIEIRDMLDKNRVPYEVIEVHGRETLPILLERVRVERPTLFGN